MAKNNKTRYLNYLKSVVSDGYEVSEYSKLFNKLMNTEFYAVIEQDENRIVDAIDFRADYELEFGYSEPMTDYISVLEVMVALAVRCENSIMSNTDFGDRTAVWFWYMVESMGLIDYTNDRFDDYIVEDIIRVMLERKYTHDGYGGLFYIECCEHDLRKAEIWYQMNWWLNTIGD